MYADKRACAFSDGMAIVALVVLLSSAAVVAGVAVDWQPHRE